MFKKQMHAAPGAQKVKNAGKGSQTAPMPNRGQISSLAKNPAATMNDYAKATPMAAAPPTPAPPIPAAAPAAQGLGTGTWPGIGG